MKGLLFVAAFLGCWWYFTKRTGSEDDGYGYTMFIVMILAILALLIGL